MRIPVVAKHHVNLTTNEAIGPFVRGGSDIGHMTMAPIITISGTIRETLANLVSDSDFAAVAMIVGENGQRSGYRLEGGVTMTGSTGAKVEEKIYTVTRITLGGVKSLRIEEAASGLHTIGTSAVESDLGNTNNHKLAGECVMVGTGVFAARGREIVNLTPREGASWAVPDLGEIVAILRSFRLTAALGATAVRPYVCLWGN